MFVEPTRTIDLAATLGSGAGFLELNRYDDQNLVRFTLAIDGVENEGLTIRQAALPALQALVGGPQLFVTPAIDFTGTGTYGINLGTMSGWYAFPLAIKLIATSVTATVGPVLTVGNASGFNSSDTDNMAARQGGWQLVSTPSAPAIANIAPASAAPLVDLSTAIQVKVVTAATGGSCHGFVAMALQMFQFE